MDFLRSLVLMRIAVNTRFLLPGVLEGVGIYSHGILSRMVKAHPDDRFYFYFDRKFDERFIYGPNVKPKVLFPPTRHPLLFPYWYNKPLARNLKKSEADVFYSPDGFMPLSKPVPSVITIHDVAHRPYPDQIPGSAKRYYDTYIPLFLEKADIVITVSEFSKEEIIRYYGTEKEKIRVIYNGVSGEYYPHSEEEIAGVREKWSGGSPYFLYLGSMHPRKNVARLIDAYGIYRESGGEAFPLLLAGRKSWQTEEMEKSYQQSKFKEDIRFLGSVAQTALPSLLGGALALCYCSIYEGFGLPLVEAMASGVPVISSNIGAPKEIAGEAGCLVDPFDPVSIADAMIKIREDEQLRRECISKGLQRTSLFDWALAAEKTYHCLMQAIHF